MSKDTGGGSRGFSKNPKLGCFLYLVASLNGDNLQAQTGNWWLASRVLVMARPGLQGERGDARRPGEGKDE